MSQIALGVTDGQAVYDALAIAPKVPSVTKALQSLFMSAPRLPAPTFHKNGQLFIEQELWVPWRRYFVLGGTTGCMPFDFTICLYGTPDRVCLINDTIRIQDFKSSLYYKSEDALRKYEYEIQFDLYKWFLYEFGHVFLPLEIANIAREFRLTSQVIIGQVGSSPKWTMGPVMGFTPAKAEQMLAALEYVVEQKLLPLYTGQTLPYPNGMLTNSCGNCDFKHYCHTADKAMASHILATNYDKKPYGPKFIATTKF